ncbi:hypothetical protein KR222_006985, partial [Zaprionus bogoriensis]
VAGLPLTYSPEAQEIEYRNHCSGSLDETIRFICNGRTKSLAELYPNSFGGQRTKRLSPDEVFYRPLQNGPAHLCCTQPCGWAEIRQYCA